MKIYKDGRGESVRFELKRETAIFEYFRRSLRENECWRLMDHNFEFQILPPFLNDFQIFTLTFV